MYRLFALLPVAVVVVLGAACGQQPISVDTPPILADTLHPTVKLETTLGDITLRLDAQNAPISVANFLMYVEDKFYEGTIFHRVMPDFVIQGGGYTADMVSRDEGLHDPIKLEADNGLSNIRGTIAAARTGVPDSATSQFFINVVDNSENLDYPANGGYAVFGEVIEGMETVDMIKDTEVADHPDYTGDTVPVVPVTPVIINKVVLIGEVDIQEINALAAERIAELEAELQEELDAILAQVAAVIAAAEEEAGTEITTTESGLMYVDLVVGDGPMPDPTDTVEVHYRGTFLDGTEFDSSYSRNTPAQFPLDSVIPGWTEGVGSMNVGGERRLIIPPHLAYGSLERPGIPANSTLVFDVELLSIVEEAEN